MTTSQDTTSRTNNHFFALPSPILFTPSYTKLHFGRKKLILLPFFLFFFPSLIHFHVQLTHSGFLEQMEKQTFTSYNSHFFTARQAQTSESFHLGQSLKVKMLATRHVTHRLYTCHHHLSFICFLKVSQFTFYDNDPAPSTWKTNDRTQTH